MKNLKLMMFLLIFGIRGSSTQSLPCLTASGDNCPSSICPNTVVTYTCTISGTPGGTTNWILPTGTCTDKSSSPDRIVLSQMANGGCAAEGSSMCGPYIANSILPSSSAACLSSNLTVNIRSDLDGDTVRCNNTNPGLGISTVVSMTTVNVVASPGPVGNMTVTNTSVDQLTVTWTPPTTGGVPTSYNVTINDSSSPVVITDNGSSVYTHTFTGLVDDTLYTVSVVAINCAGSSIRTPLTNSTLALPPDNTTIKAVSVFNPNNTPRHFEITWTPVGGAVTMYGVYLDGGIHGYTTCTTPQCFYVVPVSVFNTSYVISVASVNKDGYVGPKNTTTIYGMANSIINNVIPMTNVSTAPNDVIATIDCSFLKNQSFYCVVCCSTDPSVPPDSSVYNISATRGTEVTVFLQGLTSGQMYYCKAAATNTNSNNCAGPVVGGVKVFFSFMTQSIPTTRVGIIPTPTPPPPIPPNPPSPPYWIIAIVFGVILLVAVIGTIVCCCWWFICKKKSSKGGSKKTEDTEELRVKKGTSPPPSDGTGGALYQDPKDIDHVKAPGGEMYAMADKPTRTYENAPKKPTATVTPADGGGAMYQDPKDIQHTTQGGETYAVAEKKPAKPVDHTQAPTGDMYAVAAPAGANKQPNKKR